MKIAVFSDNFYPELSGISDSIITTAKELGRRGHILKFFVPKYSQKNFRIANFPFKEVQIGENVSIHRIRSLPFPGPTGQARAVVPLGLTTLAVNKFNPDIIHTHLFFGAGVEALLAAKFLKKTLVGTSHTPVSEFVRYSFINAKWLEKFSLKYVSWYYNRCDFVSAPSQSVLDEMAQYGFRKPCVVISNPFRVENYFPVLPEKKLKLKEKYKLSKNTILYSGRIAPEKNIDVIIRAASLVKKDFPDVNFVITGHGIGRENLEELAKMLGLENQVKFFGRVEDKAYPETFQAADIFVVMSTAEAQCISMLKAMSCGLPVIGANARALPEYIYEKNGYIVESGDYKALARKIIYLLKNPEKREALGRGGIERVKNFSIPQIADQWESIYNEVIKTKIK